MDGIDDSAKAFGSYRSHRARSVIQKKAVVPYFNGECPQGRWEMTNRFQKKEAYIVSHRKGITCDFSTCFTLVSQAHEDWIKRWQTWRIGPGEDLESFL